MIEILKNKGIHISESISVSTDTRNLPAGCVFFALHGETFDGNKFAADALTKGASLVVVDNPDVAKEIGDKAVLVNSTLTALQELARDWRRYLGVRVIGVTGTNGKTTTKELLASVLKTRYNLLYTQGNLNNSIGVPLTVLQMTKAHNLALIEMGASHPGDITELVNVCEPDCGLITNVGKAHLLGFGSFDGVKQTKRELYDFLAEHNGQVFLNADNEHLVDMWETASADKDVPAAILYHRGTMLEGTNLVGDYNSENIQAALCVGQFFGISREEGEAAIRAYVPSNNRSQRLQTSRNIVIVDAYNANVTSMTAALDAFRGDTLILGDMLELGDYSTDEHQNIVNLIASKNFHQVYLVGGEFAKTDCAYHKFANVQALKEHLAAQPIENSHILLKGSHGIHLEQLIEIL